MWQQTTNFNNTGHWLSTRNSFVGVARDSLYIVRKEHSSVDATATTSIVCTCIIAGMSERDA